MAFVTYYTSAPRDYDGFGTETKVHSESGRARATTPPCFVKSATL